MRKRSAASSHGSVPVKSRDADLPVLPSLGTALEMAVAVQHAEKPVGRVDTLGENHAGIGRTTADVHGEVVGHDKLTGCWDMLDRCTQVVSDHDTRANNWDFGRLRRHRIWPGG